MRRCYANAYPLTHLDRQQHMGMTAALNPLTRVSHGDLPLEIAKRYHGGRTH
jgi:hypothetical protein